MGGGSAPAHRRGGLDTRPPRGPLRGAPGRLGARQSGPSTIDRITIPRPGSAEDRSPAVAAANGGFCTGLPVGERGFEGRPPRVAVSVTEPIADELAARGSMPRPPLLTVHLEPETPQTASAGSGVEGAGRTVALEIVGEWWWYR